MLRQALIVAGVSASLIAQSVDLGRGMQIPLEAAAMQQGEMPAAGQARLFLVVVDEIELGHAVDALRRVSEQSPPVALWCEHEPDVVERGLRVWGIPGDVPVVLGDLVDVPLTAWIDVRTPSWVLVDELDVVRWTGPIDPTSELAAERLRELQAGTLDSKWLLAETLMFRQSTKSSGRTRYLTMMERLRDDAPGRASSWMAEYRLWMNAVPQQAEQERTCVVNAFAALQGAPLECARFVHRSLFDDLEFVNHLGESFDRIDAVRAANPRLRTLEWATFRAAVAGRRSKDANKSALRLVELSKGYPAELMRAAREFSATARALDDPKLARWAELALGFASESVPPACGFERERCWALLGGLDDREAAAESMRRFAERAAKLPLARAAFVVDCLRDELLRERVDREQLKGLTDDFEELAVWPLPGLVHARALVLDALGESERAVELIEPHLEGLDRATQYAWRDCRWLRDEIRAR